MTIALLLGCSKEVLKIEEKMPNIIGTTYNAFIEYSVFTLGGNSQKFKAFKFTSSTQVIMIDYIDHTYMPRWLEPDIYELTSKETINYGYISGSFLIYGTAGTPNSTGVLSENGINFTLSNTSGERMFTKIDNASELGIFLNGVK